MNFHQIVSFKIVRIDNPSICADSANTQQWMTQEKALEEARKIRDKLNANAGQELYKLVRSIRTKRVNNL